MTMNSLHGPIASLAAALALWGGAAAADPAGKIEYDTYCAVCHGDAGAGPGPMTEYLSIAVPRLDTLAANNDGMFPMVDVLHIIDGRTGVRGHGTAGMPVWGAAFKAQATDPSGGYGAEIEARGRILSLALYLEEIQR